MIIVTGATGLLGRAVIEQLLDRHPAEQLGVSVRDPEQARELAARGVRVRRGDYADPESLAHAFEGASRVFIVSANAVGEAANRLNAAAITAAAASGAERLFYTSHLGVAPASSFPPMPVHHTSEAALRATGVPFTALRNGFYASFAKLLAGGAAQTGELRAPADGPVSYVAHADLAEATALALLDPGLDAEALPLTGGAAVDLAHVAALLGARRVVVDDDEHRAGMVAAGVPAERVAVGMGMFLAARERAFARVDPTLERMLGRPPTPVAEVL